METYLSDAAEEAARLDELAPGVREQLRAERLALLTEPEREALDMADRDRTVEQAELVMRAAPKLSVRHREIVSRVPEEDQERAARIVTRLELLDSLLVVVDGFRTTVNFDYWMARCAAEQEETTVQAHKYLQEAQRLSAGDYHDQEAREAYERAWDRWAEVYAKYPILMDDPTAEDIVDAINDYRELLDVRFEESFPPPGFKLHDLLEFHDSDYRRPRQSSEPRPNRPDQPAAGGSAEGDSSDSNADKSDSTVSSRD
jgi:hypothetical protein